MELKNVLLLAPVTGNGGIQSWTKKYLATFGAPDFNLIHVNVSIRRSLSTKMDLFHRTFNGIIDMLQVRREVKKVINSNKISIFHTTTSGDIGALRDIVVGRVCKSQNIPTIMHCRYGCIPENYQNKGIIGYLLRKSLNIYSQIWVLDQRTYNFLSQIPTVKDKVYLIPNSIEIKDYLNPTPKNYKRVAFIGNLYPTKGLYELTEAALHCDVRLDIIGPGSDDVFRKLRKIAGDRLNKSIFIHGKLTNPDAVKFMHEVDIIALPTYYKWEAFPISIIEAMSLTKMVISCPRAAIPDMLTDLDGKPCGLLVKEKSVEDIIDAINWCQNNKESADKMCEKAYEKVYNCYRTDIIYEKYRKNYFKALKMSEK